MRRATLGSHFFFSDYEPMHRLALMLRHLPLSLRQAYICAISPADPDDTPVASALLTFATAFSQRWEPARMRQKPLPCKEPYSRTYLQSKVPLASLVLLQHPLSS